MFKFTARDTRFFDSAESTRRLQLSNDQMDPTRDARKRMAAGERADKKNKQNEQNEKEKRMLRKDCQWADCALMAEFGSRPLVERGPVHVVDSASGEEKLLESTNKTLKALVDDIGTLYKMRHPNGLPLTPGEVRKALGSCGLFYPVEYAPPKHNFEIRKKDPQTRTLVRQEPDDMIAYLSGLSGPVKR